MIDRWRGPRRWLLYMLPATWNHRRSVRATWKLFRKAVAEDDIPADQTGDDYLGARRVTQDFIDTVVAPRTRKTHLQDGTTLNAKATMQFMNAMDEDRVLSLPRGIKKVFERMLKLASAKVKLNTEVMKIVRNENGTVSVQSGSNAESQSNAAAAHTALFDAVVIAAPFHLARIAVEPQLSTLRIAIEPQLSTLPEPASVIQRHVTLFSSERSLSASFFNLPAKAKVPDHILTINNTLHQPTFVSLSRQKISYRDGCLSMAENLYRLETTAPVSDADIAKLLGLHSDPVKLPSTIWIHRAVWSQSELRPRIIKDLTQLASNVFYAGGDDVMSGSLEGALAMGEEVASKLYWGDWEWELIP